MNENSLVTEPVASVEVISPAQEAAPVSEAGSAERSETPESLKAVENEAPSFFSKLKNAGEKVVDFFSHEEARKQVAESAISMVASVAGVKSFYDVPNYLHQRFMVRGIDLGPFGQGKGMTGSVERLLGANQEMRDGFGEESASESDEIEGESHSVRDAIKDLNDRLALTKEGDVKGSEQRKMIAKLLMENRTKERMSAEARSERMTTILDEYTTTKVTGMQAARETLNTALVASGAMSLRGISYSMLDGVERYQRLNKAAGADGEKPEILKDVIIGGIRETLEEATFRNSEDKSRLRTGLDSVKAWGKILRVVGMGSTVSLRPEAIGSDMEKVLDVFSGKASLGDVAENFQGNIDRTLDGYKRMAEAVNPFHAAEIGADDLIPDQGKPPIPTPEAVAPVVETPAEATVPTPEASAPVIKIPVEAPIEAPTPVVEAPIEAPDQTIEAPAEVPAKLPEAAATYIDSEGFVSSKMLKNPGIGFEEKAAAIRFNITQNNGGEYAMAGERFSIRSADGVLLGPDGKELTPESLAKFVPMETPAPAAAQESAADIAPIAEVPRPAPEMPLSAAGHIDAEGNVSSSMLRDSSIGFDDKADAIRLNIAKNGGQSYDLAGERFSIRSADGVLLGPDGKELTPESLNKFVPVEAPAPVVEAPAETPVAPVELPKAAAAYVNAGENQYINPAGHISGKILEDPKVSFEDKAAAIKYNIMQAGGPGHDYVMAGERFSVRSADGVLIGPDGKPFTEDSLHKFFPEQAPAPVVEAPAETPVAPVELPKAAAGFVRPDGNISSAMLKDPNISYEAKASAIGYNVLKNGGQYDMAGERFSMNRDGELLGPDGKLITPESLNKFVPVEAPAPVVEAPRTDARSVNQELPERPSVARGSRGGASLAERAAAANADLGKGSSAIETLQKPGVGFAEKMNSLKGTIGDGETVNMNGLNIMRKGGDFFLTSNGKSVRITEGNLNDILRIQDKGRAEFLEGAKGSGRSSLEVSSAAGGGDRIVGADERPSPLRVGRDASESIPGSRSEYAARMDTLKSAIPDGESKSIGGLTFGRDGKDIYLIDSKRGEVKLVTPENMSSILAAQRKDGLLYGSGDTPGSRGGASLAERAAAANADLGKGSSAIETLQKPGVGFAEKMNSLKGTIGDGETVNMNGLNIMRKGGDFFLTSNGKSVRITEGNLNDILRIQDKGRAEFLDKATKGTRL